MDRASSFPDESRNINPRQNDLRGFVSYPSRYYSRPQRPVSSGIPRWPGAIKPEPAFQPSRPSFPGTCPRNAVQQNTVDISVKTNAGNQAVNENAPASTPAAKDVTTTALEKLKWQAGQGPIVDLRLLVPGRNAGSIIGKSGVNMKRLRRAFGVYIVLTDATTPDRILSFNGDLGAVCATLLEAIPSIERLIDKSQDCNVRMLVQEGHAGFIIGKAGARIKELRLTTGAKIFVFPQCCPRSTERVLQVMGKCVNIANTVGSLLNLILPVHCPGPVHLYDPRNFDDWSASEYGGYTTTELREPPTQMPAGAFMGPHSSSTGAFDEDVEMHSQSYLHGHVSTQSDMCGPVDMDVRHQPGVKLSGLQSIQISIPKHLVSVVLGHRCIALKELRSESKAQVHALVPPAGAMERLLTIEGTVEQIQKAQYLVQKRYIDAMSPSATSVGGIDPNAAPPPKPRPERKRPGAPWYNDEIKKEKLLRRKLERIYRAKKTEESQQAFRRQSQKVNQMIRTVKEEYYATHGGGPEKAKKSDDAEADEMPSDEAESDE